MPLDISDALVKQIPINWLDFKSTCYEPSMYPAYNLYVHMTKTRKSNVKKSLILFALIAEYYVFLGHISHESFCIFFRIFVLTIVFDPVIIHRLSFSNI